MATKRAKRRKVWTVESITGGLMLFASAKLAKKCAGGTKVTPMVERLPGDVVLSREEAEKVANALLEAAGHVPPAMPLFQRLHEAIALLRGGR